MNYQKITISDNKIMPLPVRDPIDGQLGTPEDSKIVINSRLGFKEAIGYLYRNYPPFSMSHLVLELIQNASATIEKAGASPLVALIGEKGAGKTSGAEFASRLVDGIEPEVFQCGGRPLDDLLYEPIIESSSKNLIEILQEKYNNNSLQEINRNILETEFPEAILEDEKTGSKKLVLSKIDSQKVRDAVEVINKINKLEGIGTMSGVGIDYQEGALIRTWRNALESEKDGKIRKTRLIIDEIGNRSADSGKSLQQVWLVISGKQESTTVSKNGMSFTFSKKDMPKGFSIIATGNDDRDRSEIEGMGEAMASRWTIKTIDQPGQEDVAHRICQSLIGIPTLFLELDKKKSIEQKADILEQLRTLGTDEKLTEEELWMIRNHDKTTQASKQLAAFYSKWAKLIDPESGIDDPILESTVGHREPPGVRMAQSDIQRAKDNMIVGVKVSDVEFSDNPIDDLLNSQNKEHIKEKRPLGERIERVVLERIYQSAGTPSTKAKILEIARNEGIVSGDDEESNPNKKRMTIRDLLSTDKEKFKITEQAIAVQEQLHRTFTIANKEKFGKVVPTAEELIPIRNVQMALNQIVKMKERQTTDTTTYILNINPEYVTGNSKESPIECIPVLCYDNESHRKPLEEMQKTKSYESMISTKTFTTLLQTPQISEETLSGLWDEKWKTVAEAAISSQRKKKAVSSKKDEKDEKDEEYNWHDIISGGHRDVRIAKVLTRNEKDEVEPILIINFPKKVETWILSKEKIPVIENKNWSEPKASYNKDKNEKTQGLKIKMPKIKTFSNKEVEKLAEEIEKTEFKNPISSAITLFVKNSGDKETEEKLETILSNTLTTSAARAKIPMRKKSEEIKDI
jgi:hypothetical protein